MFERIVGLDVIDETAYQAYREAMMPILKSYGGSFGFDFRVSEVLLNQTENNINRLFTISFPNQQAMEAFFADEDYVAIQNKHLKKAIKSKTIISLHEKNPS